MTTEIQLTILGAVLITASVILLVVSLCSEPESRARFRANWWALVLVYFGLSFLLSGKLLD